MRFLGVSALLSSQKYIRPWSGCAVEVVARLPGVFCFVCNAAVPGCRLYVCRRSRTEHHGFSRGRMNPYGGTMSICSKQFFRLTAPIVWNTT